MIKNIGIIGAGSVGSALISEIFKQEPQNLYVLATGDRSERLRNNGINVNGETYFPQIYSDRNQDVHIDLLIVAVKTYSLYDVMEDFADLIDKDTVILPIQNGIVTTDIIRKRFPENRVLYGIVLRTDAHRMGRRVYFTNIVTSGKMASRMPLVIRVYTSSTLSSSVTFPSLSIPM